MPFDVQIDLFGAMQKFVQARQINEWTKLFIQLVCSFWFSSAFATGAAFVAHRAFWEAIGTGLVTASTMATIVWRRSALTNGMILALPSEEAQQEFQQNTQVISK